MTAFESTSAEARTTYQLSFIGPNGLTGEVEISDGGNIINANDGIKAITGFSDDDLIKNTNFLINELKNKKPESSKGIYLKKIFINTTMGPGLQVDPSSVM